MERLSNAGRNEESDNNNGDKTPEAKPAITADAARQTAEAYLNAGSAVQVDLGDENGLLIYDVEIGSSNVKVDATIGKVLGVETNED